MVFRSHREPVRAQGPWKPAWEMWTHGFALSSLPSHRTLSKVSAAALLCPAHAPPLASASSWLHCPSRVGVGGSVKEVSSPSRTRQTWSVGEERCWRASGEGGPCRRKLAESRVATSPSTCPDPGCSNATARRQFGPGPRQHKYSLSTYPCPLPTLSRCQ